MVAPVWITPPGNLGKIVEGEFYQVQLNASDTETYQFLSGVLPSGIRIRSDGKVEGYPSNENYIQGVPSEVGEDFESEFIVRATSETGEVADRVFSLVVTGQDAPVIDTLPDSTLDAYYDGDFVDIDFTATDSDPNDTLEWRVLSGSLPPGLTLSSGGTLSGYIEPLPTLTGDPGYDNVPYDTQAYDFRTIGQNKNYQFTLEVTDGKDIATRTYTMFVVSRSILTADTTEITADSDYTSADDSTGNSLFDTSQTNIRTPVLRDTTLDLGNVDHDNYYLYQFDGFDFDGDSIEYEVQNAANLPPGLSLDPTTGWLYGYIPDAAATKTEYEFNIRVKKADLSGYESAYKTFTITVIGEIDSEVIWPSTNLGTIQTGALSELDVVATIPSGRQVTYEFKGGYENKLPQGLILDEKGFIKGRVSFELFSLDTGTTTFDKDSILINETTFDREFTFTVRVFSNDGVIDTFETFTVTITPSSFKPYESLYVRALPTQEQRNLYETLIQNADDINPADVYRPTDFYFGIQRDIRLLVATGISPTTDTDYVEMTAQNHWNNRLRFGSLKTAQALNSDGTVRYEVVYVELVDKSLGTDPTTGDPAAPEQSINLKLQKGWKNPLTVDSNWPKVSSGNYKISAGNDYTIYPNAIRNMRQRIQSELGNVILERKALPAWMQSKQENGQTLGWTQGAPIVFCKPGTAKKIKFLLEQRNAADLKKISFEIDRYIVDNNLSKFFNTETGKYTISDQTTFDVDSGDETTFDGDGTRFFDNVDVYAEQDEGDQYIKFPRVGVFR